MGEWSGGVFDSAVFDCAVFDCGTFIDEETMAPPDRYTYEKSMLFEQVRREDEEILAVILNAVTSGILDK